MVAAEIVEWTAERVGWIDAEDQRRDLVDMRDHPVGVDQHDAVFKALDNRLGLALLINQALDVELVVLLQALGHLVELASDCLQLGEWLRPEAHLRLALADAA